MYPFLPPPTFGKRFTHEVALQQGSGIRLLYNWIDKLLPFERVKLYVSSLVALFFCHLSILNRSIRLLSLCIELIIEQSFHHNSDITHTFISLIHIQPHNGYHSFTLPLGRRCRSEKYLSHRLPISQRSLTGRTRSVCSRRA